MNTFCEFDIQKKLSKADLIQLLEKYFQLLKAKIFEQNLFWKHFNEKPDEETIGYTIAVLGNANEGFKTYLNLVINSQKNLLDSDCLRFAHYLSTELDCKILTGDYTSKCEFLLIDSGKVYVTDTAENPKGEIEVNSILSEGEIIDDFISKYREYE